MADCYLLHFSQPFVGEQRNPNATKQGRAQHYLGYAEHLDARIEHHRRGTGANLTRHAVQSGCELQLARVWAHATRKTERKLKTRKHHADLCPICNPTKAYERGRVY